MGEAPPLDPVSVLCKSRPQLRCCRSQTIFSRRAGVSHRIHGVIIAAVELALAVIPYSLVQYLVRVLRPQR